MLLSAFELCHYTLSGGPAVYSVELRQIVVLEMRALLEERAGFLLEETSANAHSVLQIHSSINNCIHLRASLI